MNDIVFDRNRILDKELPIRRAGFGDNNTVWYIHIPFKTGAGYNYIGVDYLGLILYPKQTIAQNSAI